MRVQDIMVSQVETIAPGAPAEVAYARMHARGIRHLVVLQDGRIVGIVSDRDLGGRAGASVRRGRRVDQLMTPKVVTTTPEVTVRRAASQMRGRAIGCLPVVEGDKLVGIITVSDLLEEIGRGSQRPVQASQRWTLRHRAVGSKRGARPRRQRV